MYFCEISIKGRFQIKKTKKSREFIYDFFRYPRVKFTLFFDAIRDNFVQEKGGTKEIKLDISMIFWGFLRVILTSEGT